MEGFKQVCMDARGIILWHKPDTAFYAVSHRVGSEEHIQHFEKEKDGKSTYHQAEEKYDELIKSKT